MAKNEVNDEIAKQFTCPISGRIMLQPVLCDDGLTYERIEVTKFLNECKTVAKFLDNAAMEKFDGSTSSNDMTLSTILRANTSMQKSINKFLSDNPEYKENQYQVSISGPIYRQISPKVPIISNLANTSVSQVAAHPQIMAMISPDLHQNAVQDLSFLNKEKSFFKKLLFEKKKEKINLQEIQDQYLKVLSENNRSTIERLFPLGVRVRMITIVYKAFLPFISDTYEAKEQLRDFILTTEIKATVGDTTQAAYVAKIKINLGLEILDLIKSKHKNTQKRKTPMSSVLQPSGSVKQTSEPAKRQKREESESKEEIGSYLRDLANDIIQTENIDEFYSTHSEPALKFK